MKKAFITGITGQDGSYLSELLVSKGYSVIGLDLDTSSRGTKRLRAVLDQLTLVEGDLNNTDLIKHIIATERPDEIYNLASISYVPDSWEAIDRNLDINAKAVANLLEAIRLTNPQAKMYQASSSEMFGVPKSVPQTINTPFAPQNPYAAAKAFAHWLVTNYRTSYSLFTVSGILFNHESPRRPRRFVSRKISSHVAEIKLGFKKTISLGNLKARRDWGFAGDYVRAMWLMLQQDAPRDYVIGSGELHTVEEMCQIAFGHVGLEYRDHVRQDPRYFRQVEHYDLVADPAEAVQNLKWEREVDFESMIKLMVDSDLELLKKSHPGAEFTV